jgi:hypothetical protein
VEQEEENSMTQSRRPDGTTRGGQEPPDEVQDRPEQNAAYDAVVDGQQDTGEEQAQLDADFVAAPDNDESAAESEDPDDRAARLAAADVRRRERSAN